MLHGSEMSHETGEKQQKKIWEQRGKIGQGESKANTGWVLKKEEANQTLKKFPKPPGGGGVFKGRT